MDALRFKPSRVRRMREIDNLVHELKDLYEEFEEHRRSRNRLAKKMRKLANKVKKHYPDMKLAESLNDTGLHGMVETLARSLHLPGANKAHDNVDDSMLRSESHFSGLFDLLRKLGVAPWLDPLGK